MSSNYRFNRWSPYADPFFREQSPDRKKREVEEEERWWREPDDTSRQDAEEITYHTPRPRYPYRDPEPVGPARVQANSEIASATQQVKAFREELNFFGRHVYRGHDSINSDIENGLDVIDDSTVPLEHTMIQHLPDINLKRAKRQTYKLYGELSEFNDYIKESKPSLVGCREDFLPKLVERLEDVMTRLTSAQSLLTNSVQTFQGNELPSLFGERDGLSESRQ
ncbi:uncharacterized protein L203_101225 [Cryptococcus depauperatus CBS 7841]|uniref:Uncharacterized protein n=1 Tax=Cryptococcus depauperatus CBS 7841 TaxID=1295531 RepID=A0A1E3HEY6_9TREE|nr:hypothetical protein L203_06606 [Cryptococcus depauperatus CBS 7841]